MKKLIISNLSIAVIGILACTHPTLPANWKWSLTITPQTTKHTLDSVSQAWAKDSIILKFSKMEYDSVSKFLNVEGSVDITSKGQHASGTFADDSTKSLEIKLSDGPGVSIKRK